MQILRMMICLFMINGTFVLKPIYAQEHWGKEDSIKLSKMLNGEMPIYINKKIKIEFEKSLLEHPQIEDNDEWKKYLNFKQSLTYHWLSPIDDDILTNHFLQTYNKISGITSKSGRNDVKQLNNSVVTVSDDAKPKMLKKQRKAELSRRTVCKSLPDEW